MAKVYVMDDGELRKIGFSADPETRAKQVRRNNAVRVVFEVETEAHQLVERAAHLKLAERRIVGEWFNVSVEDAIEAVQFALENPCEPGERTDTPKSFRFSDQEIALLERVAAAHGGPKKAVVAGLMALDAGKPVNVAAELRRLADVIDAKSRPKSAPKSG